MSGTVFNQGIRILDVPFRVAATETTYLDGAARPGICPFRAVILDASFTQGNVGDASQAPVKYPTPAYAAGEQLVGIVMGPQNTLPNGSYTAAYQPIGQGRSCQVRTDGIAPMITDNTTASTNIGIGKPVKTSEAANYDGLACAATLASGSSAPDVHQHIVGRAWNGVAINGGVVLVKINLQEF